MGLLSGVGNFLIKTVAPAVFKAVLPAVSEKLAQVADSFVGKAGSLAKGLASALPGPLQGLANKLIDMGVAKGQDLTNPKTFADLLSKLMGQPREVAGAPAGTGPVTLPGITTPERGAAASAATATVFAGNNANVVSRPGGGTIQEQAVALGSGLTEPALPGPNATPYEMLKYERDSKMFDRMFQMYSNAIKNREETLAAINRNV